MKTDQRQLPGDCADAGAFDRRAPRPDRPDPERPFANVETRAFASRATGTPHRARMRLKRPSVHVACGVVTAPSRRQSVDGVDGSRPSVALIVQTTQVARAIDRALSGEMVKTLRPAARGDGDGAPRHVKHAHKAKKPDALVLAFQQALLRNPAPRARSTRRRRSRPPRPRAGTAAARRCSWCARRPSPTPTRRASRPSRPKDRSASASAKPRTP